MPREWGWWTEHKLEILQDYLQQFATASTRVDERIYLDLFAGRPDNRARQTGETILGSVYRALAAKPAFTRIGLFELPSNAARLETAIRGLSTSADIRVYDGDCNVKIRDALNDFREVRWAPTFAFIDQQAAEVHWSTLELLSKFRDARYTKAELWILFGTSFLPRGLLIGQQQMDEKFADRVTALYGSEHWRVLVAAKRAGHLSAGELREELINLMRYRLEYELGYRTTHQFVMKNTNGQDLYSMIFATDHPAGDKIMASLYGKAIDRHEQMRNDAVLRRKFTRANKIKESQQQAALFDPDIKDIKAQPFKSDRVYVHEPPWLPYGLREAQRSGTSGS